MQFCRDFLSFVTHRMKPLQKFTFTSLHFYTSVLMFSYVYCIGDFTVIVEFVAGSDDVKEIRDKETREIRGLQQMCYFHIPGSAFPVQGKIRVESRMPVGKYSFSPAYRIGRYGDLEINPFETPKLTPARPEQVKASA